MTLLVLGAGLAACSSPQRAPEPPDAVRYRFDVRPPPSELGERIALLERRGSAPLELAELAELYLRQGDQELAERRAKDSLALLSSPNPARLTLARLANANHRFTEAIALAEDHPADARASHLIIATAKLALGDLEGARSAADAALRLRPAADGYLTRALIAEASDEDDAAAADFASAARAETAGSPAEAARLRALWARFLIRRGDYRQARFVSEEALRIAPELPLAIAQRAELALQTGNARAAAKDFERAHVLSGATRYLIDQARALERTGEREKVRILRDRAEYLIRRDPAGHQLELVEVLVDRGSAVEAVRLGEAELRLRASPAVRLQLGRAYAALFMNGPT